ncbi:MAG TPA: homoserine kinase [Gemmatimonadaceae bacterium]|nr:homoserine kinase [Gemmatimonadaceae bacterium]
MSARLQRASALAPGSIGNVGPGLDVLGMAVTGAGDRVTVRRVDEPGVTIEDPGHPDLPTDPARHTSGIAALAVLRAAAATDVGLRLIIEKQLPLAGGQGGSAASAVAGAVAVNRLLGDPLGGIALLACALEAETAVSGRHADNLAAALLGGVVLVRGLDPIDVVTVPYPPNLRIVLAHPDQRLNTSNAREVLPSFVERATVIRQMANVAAMIAALHSGDLELLGRALDDQIAEPARAVLLPGFMEAKASALEAGALGGSISGAGPTSFYFATDEARAEAIAAAVRATYEASGIPCTARVERISPIGALTSPAFSGRTTPPGWRAQ